MATQAQRQHALAVMRWLIANEPLIDYRQRRPMVTRGLTEQQLADMFADGMHVAMDCSEAVTLTCRLAGLANPNGRSYPSGLGFTGDMLDHLTHYTNPKAAGVGALVVFVSTVPTGDHVAQVMEPGADPLLCSHGSTGGPIAVRLSAELAAQRRLHGHSSAVFLSVAKL